MRIGRTIVIPVILALSVAGSILAGAEMSAAATGTPSVHVQQAPTISVGPDMRFHG
jgi:hypothetical protein